MADLSIDGGVLRVRLTEVERVLALHRRDIEVPVSEIIDVVPVPNIMSQLRGMRLPGTGIPGIVAIGTWRGRTDGATFHDFAVIHRHGAGVVVTTRDEHYDRILLSSDRPADIVAALQP